MIDETCSIVSRYIFSMYCTWSHHAGRLPESTACWIVRCGASANDAHFVPCTSLNFSTVPYFHSRNSANGFLSCSPWPAESEYPHSSPRFHAETPYGTIELRRFFSTGVKTSAGETVSQEAVLGKLREIVDGEDKSNPLSDEKIAAELKAAGYPVARRTVAKYRDKLGIPGRNDRVIA